jgi:hypothetical protein
MKRDLIALIILLALSGAAHAFGFGLGNRFGWIVGSTASSGSGCSATALIFTTPCNSMYVPIIH